MNHSSQTRIRPGRLTVALALPVLALAAVVALTQQTPAQMALREHVAAFVAPIALALVSRDAPAAVNAMMVGAYYLGIFIGGIVSGWLGRFYEPVGPLGFWMIHAAVVASGALFVLLLRTWLVRALRSRA